MRGGRIMSNLKELKELLESKPEDMLDCSDEDMEEAEDFEPDYDQIRKDNELTQ